MTSINDTDPLILDQISNIIPINKHLCKVIFNYINYTNETLKQLNLNNKDIFNKFELDKNFYDFDELALKAISFGYGGIRYECKKYTTSKTKIFNTFLSKKGDFIYLGINNNDLLFINVEILIGVLAGLRVHD